MAVNLSGDHEPTPPTVLVTAPIDPASFQFVQHRLRLVRLRPDRLGASLLQGPAAPHLRTANAIVCELDAIDESVLAAAPDLSLIIVCRSNPVNVDLDACARHHVKVVTTPGRNADSTADFTLALMLAALRRIVDAERWLRKEVWSVEDVFEPYRRFRGPTLANRSVGVIGYGHIGRRVVRRLLGFDAKVMVCSHSAGKGDLPDGAELTELDDLLRRSDIVTLHLASTPSASGLIGARELALMRHEALLVNTARAALVDKDALLTALRDHGIAGAALDVLWKEPLCADDPLRSAPNLLITPHIAGASDDVVTIQSNMAAAALSDWLITR